MDAARLAGLAVGGSRARDDRVRVSHIAMVSTLAAGWVRNPGLALIGNQLALSDASRLIV